MGCLIFIVALVGMFVSILTNEPSGAMIFFILLFFSSFGIITQLIENGFTKDK